MHMAPHQRLIQFIAVLIASVSFASGAPADSRPAGKKPILLAFYHPWYGTPWGPGKEWKHWNSFRFPDRYHPEKLLDNRRHDIASSDYPLIGPYDTSDPEIVRWHFRLAKAAGLDGFICSWWNTGNDHDAWSSQYKLFKNVWLPVAEQEHFKIAVLDECAHYVPDYGKLLSRITNNLPLYARSPAYLRIHGKPVWFIYQVWDDWLKADAAARYIDETQKRIGDVYWMFDKLKATGTSEYPGAVLSVPPAWLAIDKIDCFGTYSLFGNWRETNEPALAALYSNFADTVHRAGHEVELPILPGHNNTAVNPEPFVVARRDGKILEAFCRAIDAAKPDVAVVCSFNEWFEMTEIEPSSTWRDPYLYLKQLAKWRGQRWQTPPLPPASSLEPATTPH
jgi:hypothetical protein